MSHFSLRMHHMYLLAGVALLIAPGKAAAQSVPTSLDRVTIDAPQQTRAARLTVRRTRAEAAPVRSARGAPRAPRPTMLSGQRAVNTVLAPSGEDASGPVNGLVAKQSASGTKTATPLLATPQSISVVGREEMEQLGATTVSEALRYTPGIITGARPSTRYDIGSIRGFGGQSWFDYVDGMRILRGGYNAPIMDAWNVDRIEVLKGPSSVLYGSMMPGGLVNQITKKPQEVAAQEIMLRTGYPGRAELGFDITGPIDASRTLLYRFVGLGRYQESNIKNVTTERVMVTPSFTWRLNGATEVTVSGGYIYDPSSFYAVYLPATGTLLPHPRGYKIPYDFNVEDNNYAGFVREQAWVGYEAKHRFTDHLEVRHKLRYMDIRSMQKGLAPGSYVLQNGVATSVLQRTLSKTHDVSSALTTDTQAELRLDTGPFSHTILAGVDYQYLDFRRSIYTGQNGGSINFLSPSYGFFADPAYNQESHERRRQVGIYAQDQIKFDRLVITVGGRQDWFKSDLYTRTIATNTVAPTLADQSAFTYRAGAAYVFDNGVAPYVSYATSFEPVSGTGPGVNAAGGTGVGGTPFKPTTGKQWEAGLRYQPTFINGLFSLAYFDITQQNVLVSTGIANASCSTPLNCQTQAGEVRSRGLEFEAKFEPFKGMNVIASYAYVDARTTRSGTAAGVTPVGASPTGVPRHQAGLWGHYQFDTGTALSGFGFGAGVRYNGQTFADPANLYTVPAYTLVDAALSYDFGVRNPNLSGLKLSINATNLFGKKYVASCSAVAPLGFCYYGESRAIMATLNYKW